MPAITMPTLGSRLDGRLTTSLASMATENNTNAAGNDGVAPGVAEPASSGRRRGTTKTLATASVRKGQRPSTNDARELIERVREYGHEAEEHVEQQRDIGRAVARMHRRR